MRLLLNYTEINKNNFWKKNESVWSLINDLISIFYLRILSPLLCFSSLIFQLRCKHFYHSYEMLSIFKENDFCPVSTTTWYVQDNDKTIEKSIDETLFTPALLIKFMEVFEDHNVGRRSVEQYSLVRKAHVSTPYTESVGKFHH